MEGDDAHRIPMRAIPRALTAGLREGSGPEPAGLRWRLKQLQRQDWPATLGEDPGIKRGHTPRQLLRLIAGMVLLDAGVGPTEAARLARENENAILAIMASLAGPRPVGDTSRALVALLRPRVLDGDEDAGSADLEPVVAEVALGSALRSPRAGAAVLVIDFATATSRTLAALDADDELRTAFDRVMSVGVRETAAGRGRIASDRPVGDRYATRRAGAKRIRRASANRTSDSPRDEV